MKKIFILDTNVLLHDPKAILAFQDNEVVLPLVVLDELDCKKVGHDEIARNARTVIRLLDEMRVLGSIHKGVKTAAGGTIRVELNHKDQVPSDLDPNRADNRIISVALGIKKEHPDLKVILVSKDINLRVKCDALDVYTEDYNTDSVASNANDIYPGVVSFEVSQGEIDTIHRDYEIHSDFKNLHANQYVHLKSEINPKNTALTRYDAEHNKLVKIESYSNIWNISPRNMEQALAFDALFNPDIKLVTMIGQAGCGKAQSLDSLVYTEDGPKKMGNIKIGDKVCTPDGKNASVLGVYPQGKKKMYKVIFSDGSYTECCDEHLWYTQTQLNRDANREGSVKTLEEIKNSLRYGKYNKRNHSIPITEPVNFGKNDNLPIDPYIMGLLLGDGGFKGSISFTTVDNSILDDVNHFACDNGLQMIPKSDKISFYITKAYKKDGKRSSSSVKNWLMETIRSLDLYDKKSSDKFVPDMYKYASINDRIAVLQGLMDTDGTIGKNSHVSFTTTSELLAKDVSFIVQSLGGTVKVKERITSYTYGGVKKFGSLSYRLNMCLPNDIIPFRLKRKADRLRSRTKYFPRRYVDKVEYIGEKEAQCIYINHPDHLYLTDNFIVTHNTLLAAASGVSQLYDSKRYKKLIISRPIVPMGRDLGYLPGTIEDKMRPWMAPLQDNLDLIFSEKGKSYLDLEMDRGNIEVEALTYIRGRSIPNSYIIVDECLTEGHLISMLDGSLKDIKDIVAGDQVISTNISDGTISSGVVDGVIERDSEEVLGIKTSVSTLNCTPNHPLFIYNNGFVKKQASDVNVGDFIPVPRSAPHAESSSLSEKEAYFLGMILSDGNITKDYKTIKVAVKKDIRHFEESFRDGVVAITGQDISKDFINKRGDYTICLNRKSLIQKICSDYGLTAGNKAKIIRVPKPVFSASKNSVRHFISSLFDAEGDINITNSGSLVINYTTASLYMAKEVQHLLKKFGIVASRMDRTNRKSGNDMHRVYITGLDAYMFYQSIGFCMKRKQDILAFHFKNYIPLDKARIPVADILRKRLRDQGIKWRDSLFAPISSSKTIYRYMLNSRYSEFFSKKELEFFNKHNFCEVKSVQSKSNKCKVYDFRVPELGTFCADGILSSNCQNLTRHEIKTIITRIGEGSKIVLTGDILQIDNPFIDSLDNGLSFVVEKFKNDPIAAHITLQKGERSELATKAAELL